MPVAPCCQIEIFLKGLHALAISGPFNGDLCGPSGAEIARAISGVRTSSRSIDSTKFTMTGNWTTTGFRSRRKGSEAPGILYDVLGGVPKLSAVRLSPGPTDFARSADRHNHGDTANLRQDRNYRREYEFSARQQVRRCCAFIHPHCGLFCTLRHALPGHRKNSKQHSKETGFQENDAASPHDRGFRPLTSHQGSPRKIIAS